MKFIVNNSVKIVEAVKNVRCLYRVLVHFLLSLRFVSANISVMHQANRHCSPSCFYYVFDSSILFFIHSSILSVSEMKNKTCIFVHAFHHLCVFVCVCVRFILLWSVSLPVSRPQHKRVKCLDFSRCVLRGPISPLVQEKVMRELGKPVKRMGKRVQPLPRPPIVSACPPAWRHP